MNKNETELACSTYGEQEKYVQSLVGKPEEKSSLGRPRRRWKNIKLDIQDVTDWIDLAQDRDRLRAVVNEVPRLQVP
jgi:hypothetical protein